MNAYNRHNAAQRLRAWWLTPPRHGMAVLLWPFEYRRAHLFGAVRVAGSAVAAIAGLICLSYTAYGWAAFFLVVAALNLAAGYWLITIARSRSART
jgi:hypothetical protein